VRHRITAGAVLAGLALALMLAGVRTGHAQTLQVSAQVEVPVLGDNLDRA
jgi:transcriptional regulator GlxA family with amidase domain